MQLYLRNIKKGFATNSSSYHSTTILSQEEFDKWKKGEIRLDIGYSDDDEGLTYEEWQDSDSNFEVDFTHHTTPGGEKIVVICEHGSDY